MKQIFLVLLIVFLSIYFCHGANTTAKTGPTTKKPRKLYSCPKCVGKGNDCKGTQVNNCWYCLKMIGSVKGDPKDPFTQAFLAVLVPGVKANDYLGKEVTIKECVTEQYLKTFKYPDRAGCGPVDDFNIQGYGCVCEGDCKEPTSSKVPTSTSKAPTSTAPPVSTSAAKKTTKK